MLAAVIESPGVLAVREVPVPRIDETECLVEILACSICNSTDRKLLDGHFRYCGPDAYPGIVGHEGVGRVVECGSAVQSFKVGISFCVRGHGMTRGRRARSAVSGAAWLSTAR